MTVPAGWKKSSHSQPSADCVEVRADLGAIRDTKNPGLHIEFSVQALVAAIRDGHLD